MENVKDIPSLAAYFEEKFVNLEKLNILDDLSAKMDMIVMKQGELDTRCSVLEDITNKLRSDVITLKSEISAMKQGECSNKIIVRGIPELDDPDADAQLTSSLLAALEVPIEDANPSHIHRLGKVTERNGGRPMEIHFLDTKQAQTVLNAKKKIRPNCSIVRYKEKPIGNADEPIYVEQKLSDYNSYLYYVTRTMKKKGIVKYAWTANGKVLVRRTEKSKTKRIEHEGHLSELLEDNDESVPMQLGEECENSVSTRTILRDRRISTHTIAQRTRSNSMKRAHTSPTYPDNTKRTPITNNE